MQEISSKIEKNGVICSFFVIWLLFLAFLWNFEEPSKLVTILVFLIVFFLAVLIIHQAKKAGIVVSENAWLLAFLLKVTLSFLITSYLWALPLSPDKLRVPESLAVQDSNVYDLEAKNIIDYGHTSIGLWLDFGVVRYIAIIYKIFGISVLYVSLFNTLLSLSGFIFLTGILKTLDEANIKKWQFLRFSMFLPFGAYLDATPAKEPLTIFAFFFALFLFAQLIYKKVNRIFYSLTLLIVFFLLALIRINVFLLLIFVGLTLIFTSRTITRKNKIATLLIITILFPGVFLLGYKLVFRQDFTFESFRSYFFDINKRIEVLSEELTIKENTLDPLKFRITQILIPVTVKDLILYSPVRMVAWWYQPYPFLFDSLSRLRNIREDLIYDYKTYILTTASVFPRLSSLIVIMLTPAVIAAFLDKSSKHLDRRLLLVVILFAGSFLISNFQIIESTRHRFLMEPIILSLGLWGYANAKPKRYYFVWFLFAAVLGIVYVMKIV